MKLPDDVSFILTKKIRINMEKVSEMLQKEGWNPIESRSMEQSIEIKFVRENKEKRIRFGNDGETWENDNRVYFWS